MNDAVIVPGRALSIGDVLVVENLSAYHAFDAFRKILQNGELVENEVLNL